MSSPLILSVSRNWQFEVKPLYSLVMLLGIVICFFAASWQYNKSIYFQAAKIQTVELYGQYMNEYTHYLDNQTLNGKAGYAVITPFKSEGKVFLINRGFVAFENRDYLPVVEKISGKTTIKGTLKEYKKPLLLNETLQDPLQYRIQFIDEFGFERLLGSHIEPLVVMQDSGKGLLEKQEESTSYLSQHKHQAYAMQWFLLALCGVCVLVLGSLKRGSENE